MVWFGVYFFSKAEFPLKLMKFIGNTARPDKKRRSSNCFNKAVENNGNLAARDWWKYGEAKEILICQMLETVANPAAIFLNH